LLQLNLETSLLRKSTAHGFHAPNCCFLPIQTIKPWDFHRQLKHKPAQISVKQGRIPYKTVTQYYCDVHNTTSSSQDV